MLWLLDMLQLAAVKVAGCVFAYDVLALWSA